MSRPDDALLGRAELEEATHDFVLGGAPDPAKSLRDYAGGGTDTALVRALQQLADELQYRRDGHLASDPGQPAVLTVRRPRTPPAARSLQAIERVIPWLKGQREASHRQRLFRENRLDGRHPAL